MKGFYTSQFSAPLSALGLSLLVVGGLASIVPGNGLDISMELKSPNEQEVGRFAHKVDSVPDVNGDGKGDLIVGAYREDLAGDFQDAGRAYIFSGADGAVLQTLESPNAVGDGNFGFAVAGVPDVNGDGYGDVAVQAPGDTSGDSPQRAGRVYVFSGNTGELLHELKQPTERQFGTFGYGLAGLPDLNGDGRGEIAASGADLIGTGLHGRVYIFSGVNGALLDTITRTPDWPDMDFGWSVAAVSDLNNDNVVEILVGADDDNHSGSTRGAGAAYLFSGSDRQLIKQLLSPNIEYYGGFGYSVTGIPDVNGDGKGDFAIGADEESPGDAPSAAGRAYIYSGADQSLLHTLVSPNEQEFGQFGIAIGGVADFDGDQHGDLVVGQSGIAIPDAPIYSGVAYVFSGNDGSLICQITSPNEEELGSFGWDVAGMPDVDGDGQGEVIVAARNESPGDSPDSSGRVYVFSAPPGQADGRTVGDFDSSGCTDLTDFLFLLDNWQQVVGEGIIDLGDFLNLLDNWQQGPSC